MRRVHVNIDQQVLAYSSRSIRRTMVLAELRFLSLSATLPHVYVASRSHANYTPRASTYVISFVHAKDARSAVVDYARGGAPTVNLYPSIRRS